MTLYEIFSPNNDQPITDGYDLSQVIVDACEFLATQIDGPGVFKEDYIIVATDEDTGEERRTTYTIKFHVEKPFDPDFEYGTLNKRIAGVK